MSSKFDKDILTFAGRTFVLIKREFVRNFSSIIKYWLIPKESINSVIKHF